MLAPKYISPEGSFEVAELKHAVLSSINNSVSTRFDIRRLVASYVVYRTALFESYLQKA